MKKFISPQKFFLLALGFCLNMYNAYSQQSPCWLTCDNLVTKNLTIDSVQYISYGNSSASDASNYSDAEYRDVVPDPSPDIVFNDCGIDLSMDGDGVECATNLEDYLKYEVYFPKNNNYSQCKLPPVILFHPGGFSDCSGAFGELMREYCRAFAHRGFVCFNVEYRLGKVAAPGITYSAQQILAYYRAFQDGRGAIRSIIKRQQNHSTFNDPYQIDTNNIIVGGASAGGAIAINLAYYPTQIMENQIFNGTNVKNSLGDVDINYYYGTKDIEYFSKIKGLIILWSNGFVPVSFASDPFSFFENNGHFPAVIAFQGIQDMTAIPDDEGVPFSPPSSTFPDYIYHTETHCIQNTSFVAQSGSVIDNYGADTYRFGARSLYTMLENSSLNIPHEVYLDCDMGHGLDSTCDTTACASVPGPNTCADACATYVTDFGTGYKTRPPVAEYIVQRCVTFFQSVTRRETLGTNLFVNCKNNRHDDGNCNTDNTADDFEGTNCADIDCN